jgi:hypothetical protein
MKFIKAFTLNEFHPGAKTIGETINFFIESGENSGIPERISHDAIKLILKNYLLGKPKTPFIKRGSLLHKALNNMESCIHTMLDDGYPEEWIYSELRKFA